MKSSVQRGWKFQPGVIIIYHNTWCVLFFVWFPTRQKKGYQSLSLVFEVEDLGASLFSVEVSRGNRENGHTWRSERLSHFDRWLWWLCDRLIMAFLVGWYFFSFSVWGNFETDRMFHSSVAVGINVSDKLTFVFFLVAGNWDFLLSILAHNFAE